MVKISHTVLLCINGGFLAYLLKFLLARYKHKFVSYVSRVSWLSRNGLIKRIIGYNACANNRFQKLVNIIMARNRKVRRNNL